MNIPFQRGLWLLFISLFAWQAQAHTPYLLPSAFEFTRESWVSVDASFADQFFVPDVAFDQSEFHVIGPSGDVLEPAQKAALRTRTLAEHRLSEQGTYRFSTGRRYGAVFRIYEHQGERRSTRNAEEVLPEGAELLEHFQSVTLAETYVTLGAPSDTALKAYSKGLELVALSHPTDVYQGEALRVQLLFDGKPLANQTLQVFKGDGSRRSKEAVAETTTNAKGEGEFELAETGTYLLWARYRHPAPAGAKAPDYSYTYTLSFPVNEQ